MKFTELRSSHNYTTRQFRRARKLYIRIIAQSVYEDHSRVWLAVHKMKERGLYSKNTMDRDICWSVMRTMWKLSEGSWESWLLKYGWGKMYWSRPMKIVA